MKEYRQCAVCKNIVPVHVGCIYCIARSMIHNEDLPKFSKQSMREVIQIAREEVVLTNKKVLQLNEVLGLLDILSDFVNKAP